MRFTLLVAGVCFLFCSSAISEEHAIETGKDCFAAKQKSVGKAATECKKAGKFPIIDKVGHCVTRAESNEVMSGNAEVDVTYHCETAPPLKDDKTNTQ